MIPLCCPNCRNPIAGHGASEWICRSCGASYPITAGIRNLVRPDRRAILDPPASSGTQHSTSSAAAGVERAVLVANVAYHASYAEAYETDRSTALVFSREAASRIGEVVELARVQTQAKRWLDVGCGTGHVLTTVGSAFPESLGADLSTEMLQRAAAKGLNVIRAEACCLPVEDHSVDVVSAFALLHHLYNAEQFFREAHRVLRPGGVFYSDSDPNVRARRSGIAYRSLRNAYYRLRRMGQAAIDDDREARAVGQLADYQMFHGEDFNGDTQAAALRRAGFAPANAIYHFNTDSIYNPSRATVATHVRGMIRSRISDWFDMRIAADHFILLASKPR